MNIYIYIFFLYVYLSIYTYVDIGMKPDDQGPYYSYLVFSLATFLHPSVSRSQRAHGLLEHTQGFDLAIAVCKVSVSSTTPAAYPALWAESQNACIHYTLQALRTVMRNVFPHAWIESVALSTRGFKHCAFYYLNCSEHGTARPCREGAISVWWHNNASNVR